MICHAIYYHIGERSTHLDWLIITWLLASCNSCAHYCIIHI